MLKQWLNSLQQATDLGDDDSEAGTQATASFTIKEAGSFKVCYKLSSGSYVQVGSKFLSVTVNSTEASGYWEDIQNVSLSILPDCHSWTGFAPTSATTCNSLHAILRNACTCSVFVEMSQTSFE